MHLYIKLAFSLVLLTDRFSQPSELRRSLDGANIITRFSDNSDSKILKFLKRLTKLLGMHVRPSHTALQ